MKPAIITVLALAAVLLFLIARYGVLQDPGFLPEKCAIEGFECVAYASDGLVVELSSEERVDALTLTLESERSRCEADIGTLQPGERRTITLGCELEARTPARFNATLSYEDVTGPREAFGEVWVVG